MGQDPIHRRFYCYFITTSSVWQDCQFSFIETDNK